MTNLNCQFRTEQRIGDCLTHAESSGEGDNRWLKRIRWAKCDGPFANELEGLVSLRVEGYISTSEAKREVDEIKRLSKLVDRSYSKEELRHIQQTEVWKNTQLDIAIAKEFLLQCEKHNPEGVASATELLRRVISDMSQNEREV